MIDTTQIDYFDDFVLFPAKNKTLVSEKVYFIEECDAIEQTASKPCVPVVCDNCVLNADCELMVAHRLLKYNNPDTQLPAYVYKDIENCVLRDSFDIIPCGSQNIADGIGSDYMIAINSHDYKINADDPFKWNPYRPVAVSAQTGSGKTYFVENTVVPFVRRLNHRLGTAFKVLIVSNRKALELQYEDRLHPNDQNAVRSYGEHADVTTYHGLLSQLGMYQRRQQSKMERYLYVVFDECHFFTSDALFNPNTARILISAIDTFKNAIRVYMTATPYECMRYIIEYEGKVITQPPPGCFKKKPYAWILYHFTRQYDYLDVKYYTHDTELRGIIKKSGNDKWLVFIDDTMKCKELKNYLESNDEDDDSTGDTEKKSGNPLAGRIMTVDAGSKGDSRYELMVKNERLDKNTSVLISTSVLDNGVNLRDIQNVVLTDTSQVKCLQMLGRVRVDRDKEKRVTLYIKRTKQILVEKRINGLMRIQDAHYHWLKSFGTDRCSTLKAFFDKYVYGEEHASFQHLFKWEGDYISFILPGNTIYKNDIATPLVGDMIVRYESILAEMKTTDVNPSDGDKTLPGQKYLEYMLSWFNQSYNPANDISLVDKDGANKRLTAFLEPYAAAGTRLFEGEPDKVSFKKEFTELYNRLFGGWGKNKSKRNDYSSDVINKILKKHRVRYCLETGLKESGSTREYWQVVND